MGIKSYYTRKRPFHEVNVGIRGAVLQRNSDKNLGQGTGFVTF